MLKLNFDQLDSIKRFKFRIAIYALLLAGTKKKKFYSIQICVQVLFLLPQIAQNENRSGYKSPTSSQSFNTVCIGYNKIFFLAAATVYAIELLSIDL